MKHEAYWVTVASITPVIAAAAALAIEYGAKEWVRRIDQAGRKFRLFLLVLWSWWTLTIVGLGVTEFIALGALRTGHTPSTLSSSICSGALGAGVASGVIGAASTSIFTGFLLLIFTHAYETRLRTRIRSQRRRRSRRLNSRRRRLELEYAQLQKAILSTEDDSAEKQKLRDELGRIKSRQHSLDEVEAKNRADIQELQGMLERIVRRRLVRAFGSLFPVDGSAETAPRRAGHTPSEHRQSSAKLPYAKARQRTVKHIAGRRPQNGPS